jgi:hypothetical protein
MTTAPARRRGQLRRPPHACRSRGLGVGLCFAIATALCAREAGARASIDNPAHSPAPTPAPPPIGVIAPAGSRLAGELKREIAAANLTWASMVTSDRDWPAEMTDLVALPYLQGVVVGSDDGRMIVFSRGAASGRVEVRFELRFDPNDRPARRRACLAVVESLRVLGETSAPPLEAGEGADAAPPEASAAGSPAPGTSATPTTEAGRAATSDPAAGLTAGAASGQASDPMTGRVSGPIGARARTSAHPLAIASASAPSSLSSPSSSSTLSSSAISTSAPAGSARVPTVGVVAPLPEAAPPDREPWVMGVATMLDVDRALGAPMGHLQFVWLIPIGERFAFRVQAMWPLMGTQLRSSGSVASDARVWTFGAAMGLHYLFAPPQARLRPFVGLATGSQILLTDTSDADTDKGRALFVTSANLRVQSGVRYAIASRVQLLVELEATRDWLIQSRQEPLYRDSIANTVAFHASLGVLFEY